MWRAAACLLLLLASPVEAGELIRFRNRDGTVGMVDHPSKLPPGATVLDRRAGTVRAEEPEAPDGSSVPAAASRPGSRAPFAEASAAGSEAGSASMWCDRGRRAHQDVENAVQRVEGATERLEECEDSPRHGACAGPRHSLETAEGALERAERKLEDLEGSCRDAGCLPGWLRGDCR